MKEEEQCLSLTVTMRGTAERERGARQLAVTLEQGASCVTSADRNRRACGGGCALFTSRLSPHTLTHMTDC